MADTVAQSAPYQATAILKNATIAVPLKYLSKFWRSLEMQLINCQVELKIKYNKYYISAAVGADNANADSNNNIFTTKGTKMYVPVVNLSTKDNQKLSKLLRKGFGRSVYWNEYKTKIENKKCNKGV